MQMNKKRMLKSKAQATSVSAPWLCPRGLCEAMHQCPEIGGSVVSVLQYSGVRDVKALQVTFTS